MASDSPPRHGAWPAWSLAAGDWSAAVPAGLAADGLALLAAIADAVPGAHCLDCGDGGVRHDGAACRCPAAAAS